ncbi:carbohydrate ABC transporter permease [Paenibacillus humicola]|uniref:carbohydrate ABC transporter permease n=1 Tax=Paenibacillus humicola TaxID=3110540 RepID=UPI00237A59F9|nr:sugar ABC transporter permease [Paenibacillus humicola]
MGKKLPNPRWTTIYGFMLPGILVYLFIVIVPLALSIHFSFYKWSGGLSKDFIGFHNYSQLLQDAKFWFSFRNNMIITLLSIIGQLGIAFVLAVILQAKWVKLRELHRTVLFLPVVLPAVVVGFIWNLIYSQNYGILNSLLKGLHLADWIRPWLDDPKIVIYSVTIPIIWQWIGLYLIIFMASIQSIPGEIYEGAEIDGATGFKKVIYITLPMMYDTLRVAIMLCIAGNMKIFDNIFVMTGGGPGNSSTVMAQYAYNTSFGKFQLGYGSAISIGMIVLSLGLILLSRRLMGGRSLES